MSDPQLTHHIQLEILKRMLNRPESRYSDLKPQHLEANLFVYHLKQLMRLGLIEKQDKLYILTRSGKHYADRVTMESMKIRLQPKIVTVLAIRRSDGKWLMQVRKQQPFTNYKGFPSGKVHYGETLDVAATRELQEKAQLTDINLTLRGNIVMRFNDAEDTINHVIGYVFYGETPATTTVDFDTEYFSSYFANEADFFLEPCFAGHQEILALLKGGRVRFVEEYTFKSAY